MVTRAASRWAKVEREPLHASVMPCEVFTDCLFVRWTIIHAIRIFSISIEPTKSAHSSESLRNSFFHQNITALDWLRTIGSKCYMYMYIISKTNVSRAYIGWSERLSTLMIWTSCTDAANPFTGMVKFNLVGGVFIARAEMASQHRTLW